MLSNFLFLLGCLSLAFTRLTEPLNGMGWEMPYEKAGRVSVNRSAGMLMTIDAGWYSFAYGKANTLAYRSFSVINNQVVQLMVTSCFCIGNVFSVYDNGQPIMLTSNPTATPSCSPPVPDPNQCASPTSGFSTGTALLLPGRHNITIVVTKSPYSGGTGFLRVDTACPNPDFNLPPIPCCQAYNTCSKAIMA